MATTYYPDFSKLSQYDETSGVEAVRYAADTPLTEMDLNEMQLIQNSKRRNLTKQLFKDGFNSNGGNIRYTNGVLTITNKTAFVNGYMVYIDSVSLPVPAGETAYLNVFEKQSVGPNDTLKKYGNENGETIANYIMDSRYGQEITRRIVVAYELSTSKKSGANTLTIGTVDDNGISMSWIYKESVVNTGGVNYNTKEYLYENGREIPFTWAELKAKRESGDFSGLEIGDYKTIQMEGEFAGVSIVMEIAGIDVYYGHSTNYQHSIDFVIRDVLCKHRMHSENRTNFPGYPLTNMELYTYLQTNIYNSLPSDVKENMVSKKVLLECDKNGGANGWTSIGWQWIDLKLWFLADIELFGYQSWSQKGQGSGNFKQYPLFKSEHHLIKKLNGSPLWYWLLQPCADNSTHWCDCGNRGASSHDYHASDEDGGVVFGFRI